MRWSRQQCRGVAKGTLPARGRFEKEKKKFEKEKKNGGALPNWKGKDHLATLIIRSSDEGILINAPVNAISM